MMMMDIDGSAAQLKINRFLSPSSPPPPRIPHFCCIRNYHRLTRICSIPSPIFSSPNVFFRGSAPGTSENTKVRGRGGFRTRAGESPYQVLGVSPSATPDDIKRAYRKLALKYHPDVNKEPGAQEKFMRIKHAYNTLLDSKSRRKYDQDGTSYAQRRSAARRSQDEEDFYGLGEFVRDVQVTLADFFRDIQEEFRNWETSGSPQGKPKSLWEELSEIGEEFVEFLEKELNITNSDDEADISGEVSGKDKIGTQPGGSDTKNGASKNSSIDNSMDEIEATLAQLKRDLGL